MQMQINNYLRLALMFGDNRAEKLNKNLEKMIKLVLFEKDAAGLTVIEIMRALESKYALEFSETEILAVLTSQRCLGIICLANEEQDTLKKRFALLPDEMEKIRNKIQDTTMDEISREFCESYMQGEIVVNDFKELIIKYFYTVFNSSSESIVSMLNNTVSSPFDFDNEFTLEEKDLINEFVLWNNPSKDKFVYKMVSCCFDYCMMTLKKEKASYNNVFKNKRFFLDSNIVFRLIGLNQENRKQIIQSFIKKCKEVNIQILYTNYTKKELFDTVDFNVEKMKSILASKQPLSVKAMRFGEMAELNMGFYEFYVNWCKSPENKAGNFDAFKDDLKFRINNVLSEFNMENCSSFEDVNESSFADDVKSLTNFKIGRNKNANRSSVKADINNYLYVVKANETAKSKDILGIKNFIISADHCFVDWDKEHRPGAVPTVVLPSVWYSLILKYNGRSDDDFLSFTRFLNFSVSQPYEEDEKKKELLLRVLELNEPTHIQEKTIFDIEQKLASDEYSNMGVDEIVEASHEYIVNIEVESARQTLGEEYDIRIASIEQKHADELRQKDQDIDNLTKMNAEELVRATMESNIEGEKVGQDKVINKLAEENARKKKKYYIIVTVIFFVVCLALFLMYLFLANEEIKLFVSSNEQIISVVGLALISAFCWLCYDVWFLKYNYDAIFIREKKKIERKYKN